MHEAGRRTGVPLAGGLPQTQRPPPSTPCPTPLRTITAIYPSPSLLAAAAEAVTGLLRSPSANLRYVGLGALAGVTRISPKYAVEHQVGGMGVGSCFLGVLCGGVVGGGWVGRGRISPKYAVEHQVGEMATPPRLFFMVWGGGALFPGVEGSCFLVGGLLFSGGRQLFVCLRAQQQRGGAVSTGPAAHQPKVRGRAPGVCVRARVRESVRMSVCVCVCMWW
jgi:hypothetical protein